MDFQSHYQNLKENLSHLICAVDLEVLKKHFSKEISSKRALSNVHSAGDLFTLLEVRDYLSPSNVSCLENLGCLISKNQVNDLVHTYKKLYISTSYKCICEVPGAVQNPNDLISNCSNDTRCHEDQMVESGIDRAIARICENIGEAWPVLVRELHVTERAICDIRRCHKSDVKSQAAVALKLWKDQAGTSATVATLDSALNQRLCKRQGLGSHLISGNQILCA